MKLVPRERDAPVLDRARVQDVHEHALPRPHPDRLTRAQRPVVDRIDGRAHLQPVGTRIENRRFFGLRPLLVLLVGVHELRSEERFPIPQRQKDLLVVAARILARFDNEEPELPRVAPAVQVVHRHRMRVIPACACRFRRELIPPAAVRRHRRRALFLGAVDLGRNQQAVPVNLLRHVGVVHDIHGHGHALAHP